MVLFLKEKIHMFLCPYKHLKKYDSYAHQTVTKKTLMDFTQWGGNITFPLIHSTMVKNHRPRSQTRFESQSYHFSDESLDKFFTSLCPHSLISEWRSSWFQPHRVKMKIELIHIVHLRVLDP